MSDYGKVVGKGSCGLAQFLKLEKKKKKTSSKVRSDQPSHTSTKHNCLTLVWIL